MTTKSPGRTPPPILPEAREPGDMLEAPFVGNASIDDNVRECVQVGLWAVLREAERALSIGVAKGVVTLSGPIPTAKREAVLKAAHAVHGVRKVIDCMTEASAPAIPADADQQTPAPGGTPEPFIYVTRYCGESDASSAAAIRDAVAVLDRFLAGQDAAPATQLLVLYRNHLPGAITLEIGFPTRADIAARAVGEIRAGTTPAGQMRSILPPAGFGPVLAAATDLIGQDGRPLGHDGAYAFQRFVAEQFRPWCGHPSTPLMAPMQDTSNPSALR